MTDIFISYKHTERPAIEVIASSLCAVGLKVWFDASLNAGETFTGEIDREVRSAKVVLVCWSPLAIESQWVRSEALIGFDQRKLVACRVAGPDRLSLPVPFNGVHTADLREWLTAANERDGRWHSVLRRIGHLCRRKDIKAWIALDEHPTAEGLRAWLAAHATSPMAKAVEVRLATLEEQAAERARLEQRAREEAYRRAREEQERASEAAAWNEIHVAPTLATVTAFLRRFPVGQYADDARAAIEAIEAGRAPTIKRRVWSEMTRNPCGCELECRRLPLRLQARSWRQSSVG